LRSLPCDGLSNLLHLSSSPTTNSKYLYYVNAEPTRKQPLIATSTNAQRKSSGISITVPWNKQTRSSTDDKSFQKPHKMSRDRLLSLDKLFSGATHTITDEDQASPINDLTPLDETVKLPEKNIPKIKENGYLRNSTQLVTR